ncbi:alpha/beta fold hydrolase [Actinoplanes sp. M2I2]|uniref:alpha/beta fold hydrolase n=1 Tax=Actinoplanes sp. M2I2 TaxID=1734444 RepID=UPI00201FDA7B|nr:alpha/beta hydrolase [Actinoplanes sp. M2I2]
MNQQANDENDTTGRRGTSRRTVLAAGTGAALGAAAVAGAGAAPAAAAPRSGSGSGGTRIPVAPGVEVNIADLNGGRRGTVVFVPGWPLASTALEYNLLFLADQGYRAIALDQRGFGLSDAPYGPYGYDVWARDIQTVLEALSLRDVTLVGHSMGGAVALRHASRFGNRIGKLVVAEPAAPRFVYGPQSAGLAAGLQALISGYAADRTVPVRDLTKNFFATHTDVATDPFLQFFERQCLDQASLPASRAGLIALRDDDLTADLARIKVPTRVFHAINDKILPLDHGQAVAAGIRGARLVTFATAGHAVYVDERDKFNSELLSFIR